MTRLEKGVVWGSTVAVAATGFAYTWMKYLLEPADPWAVVNHPLQPLVLKLHILSSPLLVFGLGMIALRHIWPHLKAGLRKGRRSGIVSAAVTIPMVLTGYLIQAVTHAGWLTVIAWTHIALGTVFAVGAGAHALATRRTARRARPARAGEATGRMAPASYASRGRPAAPEAPKARVSATSDP